MIKVDRGSPPPPSGLLSRARESREQFFRTNADRLEQLRIPKPDSIALRHLLKPLRSCFGAKCGYCERRVEDGILEHFRPQSVHDIGEGSSSSHLHYSWLVYEWDNTIYSCSDCSVAKAAYFPVRGPRARVGSSVDECRAQEHAHLLDPTFDEPNEHIGFDKDGSCVSLSENGGRTISILDLNRGSLVQARKAMISAVWAVFSEGARLERSNQQPNSAVISALSGFTDQRAEFAGAARAVLQVWIAKQGSASWVKELENQFVAQGWFKGKDGAKLPQDFKSSNTPKRAVGRRQLPIFANDSLTKIEIENFKGIDSADFQLGLFHDPTGADYQASCLVLLGENSVGKSTVLEAISLALSGKENLSRLNISIDKYLSRNSNFGSATKDGWVKLFFNNRPAPDVILKIDSTSKKFELTEKSQVVLVAYGPRRFYSEGKRRIGSRARSSISSLFDPLASLDDPSIWLIDTNTSDFNAAVRALREVLMLPEESAEFKKDMHNDGQGEILIDLNGGTVPLNFMSDGYKTVVATATDIIRHMLKYYSNLESAQGIVLIDEIDTHLHPRWKMEILKRMRLAFPRLQFIVSTHDPLCLRGAMNGEVAVLRKSGGTTEVITDLPNVEALSVEQLLVSDFFGLLTTDDAITERRKDRHLELSLLADRTVEEDEELKKIRSELLSKLQFGRNDEERLFYEATTEYLREKKKSKNLNKNLSEKTVGRMLAILKNDPEKQ